MRQYGESKFLRQDGGNGLESILGHMHRAAFPAQGLRHDLAQGVIFFGHQHGKRGGLF